MTKVTDDFSGTLSAWTQQQGTAWAIAASKLEWDDNSQNVGYIRYDTDVGSSDMYAQAVVSPTFSVSGSNIGPAVRMHTAAVTSYQFTAHTIGDQAIWRVVAGASAQVGSFPASVASGDTVRLEAVGAALRAKVNGSLVALLRDTNITDGQRGGINAYDDVSADVGRVDNFESGALTDDPPLAPYIGPWSVLAAVTTTEIQPSMTPVINPENGDLVLCWCVVRDAAQTISADATEGWVSVQSPSQTGLKSTLFAKVWGLAGQTDDLTPEFSVGSGTSGFGLFVLKVKNPQHATNPWTSVTDAIVASDSQSNASSTTVTAPSVTDTGTHRTVLRFFSSADDNNLGAPSTGVLVVGGTGFHTTVGNDFALAASVVEDTMTSGSTGTSTVTEASAGPDVSNGVTIVLGIPSSGGGTASPATIAATTTVPQAGTATGAGPSALSASSSLPAASVVGVTQVQPAGVAATGSLPAASVSGAASISPSTIAALGTVPTPTLDAQSNANPAAIQAAASLPAVTASGDSATAPAAIGLVAALPTPTVDAHSNADPSTVAASVALPAVSTSGASSASPLALQASTTMPTPGISTGASPATVALVASLPTPSVSAGGSVSVTPATITAAVSVLAASIGAGAGPSSVTAVAALPTPTILTGTGGTATPAAVAAMAALPQALLSAGATVSPALIAISVLLPQATATGEVEGVEPTDSGIYQEPAVGDYQEPGRSTYVDLVATAWRER